MHRYHPFGCEAWIHIPKSLQKKFQPKAERCVFLGFEPEHESFRLYRLKDKRVMNSIDVDFRENVFPFMERKKENNEDVFIYIPNGETDGPIEQEPQVDPNPEPSDNQLPQDIDHHQIVGEPSDNSQPNNGEQTDDDTTDDEQTTDEDSTKDDPSNARNTRERKPNAKIFKDYYTNTIGEVDQQEPKSYKQAIASPESRKWIEAIEKEYNAHVRNETWKEISRNSIPSGIQFHRPIWRFKIKDNGIYKARLCFDGRFQQKGIDYEETFSPVAKYMSVRLAFLYIIANGGKIEVGDVPNAFLNSDIDTDIYMYPPEGYNEDKHGIVCKLQKGLYGAKQASMLWHHEIDKFFTEELNFIRLSADRCIYTIQEKEKFVILILYVDDLAIGTNSPEKMDQIFKELDTKFQVKRLGPLSNSLYLGMKVNHDMETNVITMAQPHTIQKMLVKYGFESLAPTSSPYNPKVQINDETSEPFSDITLYRGMIGTLFWIARTTRPDILYIVAVLAQYQQKPTLIHYGAAKHVMRYLAGTINYGIVLRNTNVKRLIGYTDSSFANPMHALFSTTGFVITIGPALITWASKKQSFRVTSSAAAEYIAADSTVQNLTYIKQWIEEMNNRIGYTFEVPPLLFTDSAPMIKMIENKTIERDASKHVELREYRIIERHQDGIFDIQWIPTKDNPVDIFTKCIAQGPLFRDLSSKIVKDCSRHGGVSEQEEKEFGDF